MLYSAFANQLGDQPHQAGVTAEVAKGARPEALVAALRDAASSPEPSAPRRGEAAATQSTT